MHKNFDVNEFMKKQFEKEHEPLPSKQYIAYGSNLNVEQMKYRCPTATITGTSEIKDYELLFRGSKTGSYLTIEPKEGSVVPVVIWDIKPADEKALDRYEGYPSFYGKEDMTVLVNGKEMTAMVYTMPTHHELGMPSQSYVDTVAIGYRTADFDVDILDQAISTTFHRMKQEQNQSEIHQEDMEEESQEQENQEESMDWELPNQMRFD